MAVDVRSDPLLVGGASVAGTVIGRDLDRRLPGSSHLVDALERARQIDGIVQMERLGLSDAPVVEPGLFDDEVEGEHQRVKVALGVERECRVGRRGPAQAVVPGKQSHGPGPAAVFGVEPFQVEEVVVRRPEDFGQPDQVVGVGRVDLEVALALVVADGRPALRAEGWISEPVGGGRARFGDRPGRDLGIRDSGVAPGIAGGAEGRQRGDEATEPTDKRRREQPSPDFPHGP